MLSIPVSIMSAVPVQVKPFVEALNRVLGNLNMDVAYVVLAFWAYRVLCFIFTHFLKPTQNLKKKYGSWAVVTGATDGIGLALANEFAKNGLNVALLSRTKEKLDKCAADIATKYPKIEVKVLAVDFSDIVNEKTRTKVAKFLEPLEVGVLVNNVGVSYPFPKYFHELTDSEVDALNVLNVESTVWMTRMVLDASNANSMVSRKHGAIINIASAAGVLTSPLLAQYGGAKGYVAQFSRALHYEYASKGIHVQCQVPLYVTTKLAKLRKASLTVATPAQYARASLRAIGGAPVVSPYWSHALQMNMFNLLPESLVASVTNSMHLGIRKAGMRKEERLAQEALDTKKGK